MELFSIKGYTEDNFTLQDLFGFREDNGYSFLLSRNGYSIILSDSLVSQLKNREVKDNLKFKLIEHGLAELKDSNNKFQSKENDSIYFIIDVTKKCNFNCIYCFRNLEDNRVIEEDKLDDICNYILGIVNERKKSNVKVQIWGGEPLLAMDKLEYVYDFFKDTNVTLGIDIETNASLITDEIAKKLYDMKVNVGVSIDGEEKHQNFQRKMENGTDSMELVKTGIKNLQKYYGRQIGGITVVTKFNYKDVREIIKYFAEELNIYSMKFNLVKDNPNADSENLGLTLEEVKEFASNLFDAVEEYNIEGNTFSESNILVRTKNLIERSNMSYCLSNGCKGGKNLISIDMYGNLYPCEMTDYSEVKIGSIYKDNKLSNNKYLLKQVEDTKLTNPYFKEKENSECNDCPWKYYCQGGCTSRILYSQGEMKYDEVECEFNKVMYLKIISRILKDIKE